MFRRGPAKQRQAISRIGDGLRGIDSGQLAERVRAVRTNAGRGAAVTALLPECLALTAEAASRVTGDRPSDVDLTAGATLCAGVALDDRHLTDPALVLALPTVLHAVTTGAAHLLAPTHQDAARHAAWLRPVADQLGLRVSLLEPDSDTPARLRHHQAEIVCGAVTEFAYDHLRDWLTENPDDRVHVVPRAAVVDQIDVVLLDGGDTEPMISAPVEAPHGWHEWAANTAAALRPDEHVAVAGRSAALSPAGFAEVLDRVELADVYRDHVPVFHLVNSALTARLVFRRGEDYEVVDGAVAMSGSGVPNRVIEALTVHEGLPLTTVRTAIAMTTVRRHLLRHPSVAGIGVIDPTAARQLREAADLRVHAGDADQPSDEVLADDEARTAAVRAAVLAAHESSRGVVLAAATDRHRAAIPADLTGHGQVVVVGPDDPVPTGWRDAVLIGIGRGTTRRRDIRLARATADARWYVTETEPAAGDQAERELIRFYRIESRRVVADLRETQLDELTEHCAALFGEDPVSGLQLLLHGYLDTLVKQHRGRYAALREHLGALYPSELPPRPPADLKAAVLADADRVLAARIREVADHAGADGMARLIPTVVHAVRSRSWREHLVDLDTLSMVCGATAPPSRFRVEITARAAEQFSMLWREVVKETIGFALRVKPDAGSSS